MEDESAVFVPATKLSETPGENRARLEVGAGRQRGPQGRLRVVHQGDRRRGTCEQGLGLLGEDLGGFASSHREKGDASKFRLQRWQLVLEQQSDLAGGTLEQSPVLTTNASPNEQEAADRQAGDHNQHEKRQRRDSPATAHCPSIAPEVEKK